MTRAHGRGEGQPPFRNARLPLEERIRDLLGRLSLEEKLGLMASRQEPVPRLGLGEFHIGGEAAHGLVTKDGPSTVFPQTLGLACSWDVELLRELGSVVGDEARAYCRRRKGLGGLCLWAPTVDMERDPRWGRTEEGYGEDPWLAGSLAAALARGMRGEHPFYYKAVATPKHFYANNNEEARASCSASIDPRDRHEYYLRAFERLFTDAGALSIMTSYNAINGIPAIAGPDLGAVVKGEWGLCGFAVCDGGALPLLVSAQKRCPDVETAAALSLKAGLDNFSDDADKVKAALRGALERGLIAETDLDAAIARVLHARFRLGHFDPPGVDPYAGIDESVLWRESSRALALRAARESIVLLERRPVGGRDVLPLRAGELRSLAVLGPLADVVYRDWYTGTPAYLVTPFQALSARLPQARVSFHDGSDVVAFRSPAGPYLGSRAWYDSTLVADRPPERGGELFRRTDWGWGNQTFRSLTSGSYVTAEESKLSASAPEVWGWWVKERFSLEPAGRPSAFRLRAWNGRPIRIAEDGVLSIIPEGESAEPSELIMETIHDGVAEAAEAARGADAALVFVGNHPLLNAKEEIDRVEIGLPPEQERLIEAVLDANPRTVVVIIGSYPYALGAWRERAAGVLYATHGGQEAGRALAEVILGDYNPAGRLPMTWYRSEKDLPGIMDYEIARGGRTYQYFKGSVLYPFGHGLSYSRFWILSAAVEGARLARGGQSLIKVGIENLGPLDGEEVIQAYAQFPDSAMRRPLKKLVGAVRLFIPAGGRAMAELRVEARDLMAWDQRRSAWILEEGRVRIVLAGTSAFESLAPGEKAEIDLNIEGEKLLPRPLSEAFSADSFEDARDIVLGDAGIAPVYGLCPPSALGVKAGAASAWILYEGFQEARGGALSSGILLAARLRRRGSSASGGMRVSFMRGPDVISEELAVNCRGLGPEWAFVSIGPIPETSWDSLSVWLDQGVEVLDFHFSEKGSTSIHLTP